MISNPKLHKIPYRDFVTNKFLKFSRFVEKSNLLQFPPWMFSYMANLKQL